MGEGEPSAAKTETWQAQSFSAGHTALGIGFLICLAMCVVTLIHHF